MRGGQSKGFTLIEILLVVSAIAILAGIVIIAVNPAKQLGDTNDAQRWSDVRAIVDAVHQYSIDNNGSLPPTITTTDTEICKGEISVSSCTGFVSITDALTNDQTYLTAIPNDPQASTTLSGYYGTGYWIKKNGRRVTVHAPLAQGKKVITITQ